jgi:hypothetical protein
MPEKQSRYACLIEEQESEGRSQKSGENVAADRDRDKPAAASYPKLLTPTSPEQFCPKFDTMLWARKLSTSRRQRKKAEGRRQETEVRRQKAEVRRQKSLPTADELKFFASEVKRFGPGILTSGF